MQRFDKLNNCSFILHCDCKDYPKCIELEKAAGLDIRTIFLENLSTMFNNINQCDPLSLDLLVHYMCCALKKLLDFIQLKYPNIIRDTINDEKNKLSFNDIGDNDNYIKVDLFHTAELISKNLLN